MRKYEAKKACEAWSAKSPTYTYTWIYKTSWYEFENGETSGQKTIFDGKKFLYGERVEKEENKSSKAGLRGCWHEKDTKQFLGMQNQILKGGEIIILSPTARIIKPFFIQISLVIIPASPSGKGKGDLFDFSGVSSNAPIIPLILASPISG